MKNKKDIKISPIEDQDFLTILISVLRDEFNRFFIIGTINLRRFVILLFSVILIASAFCTAICLCIFSIVYLIEPTPKAMAYTGLTLGLIFMICVLPILIYSFREKFWIEKFNVDEMLFSDGFEPPEANMDRVSQADKFC